MISLIQNIKDDLINHGGIGLFRFLDVYFFNTQFRLLLNYRIGYSLASKNNKFLSFFARWYRYKQTTKRNCQISYKAIIGKHVKFPHPLGIIIGDNVIIGNNVKIWQQVTLGSHGKESARLDYPIIHDNVKIFAGAKVIGGVTVGEGAVIAANAVVLKNIEANDIVGGIPAKSLKSIKF